MHSSRLIASLIALSLVACCLAQDKADKKDGPPTIAEKTKGLTVRPGLIDSYVDSAKGQVFLKFPPADPKTGFSGSYLYVESLRTGLGSNDLGIDRSSFGNTFVVNVRPIADKVFFEVPNLNFRATSGDPDEQKAVDENFAKSVFWAGPVAARDADGSMLVDITDLLLTDVHGVGRSLETQGGYSLDKDRSTVLPDQCKAFPENLEFEALLTFHSGKPKQLAASHAAESEDITLAQHQSIVRLPDNNYHPRAFDPRCGCFNLEFLDFSAPLGQPLVKEFITRHRLEKTDPTAARSTVKHPIVYYVDRGVPEPIRSALIEGGNYWKEAFDAAGYIDAYRVELMPPDVDPMDLRYNVVQWMDRSTRGYAYGQSVVDPRTGEILKGAVNLDSQRARQDIMVFESLVGVKNSGKGGPNDPIQVALMRVRQLAAHEIGHTLGFQHNFAASTRERASVMDYPAPRIRVGADGSFDFSKAYATSIGVWDMQLVKYAYADFPPSDEAAGLSAILQDGFKNNQVFLSDADADEVSGASPYTNRFDDMPDPIADLQNSIRIRQIGMSHFGQGNIRTGQPIANLELVFGPLYFFHRYDANSVAKMIGGVMYRHGVRGDGEALQSPIPGSKQREALRALLACTRPGFLEVPANIARLMGPWANGYPDSAERFRSSTPFAFDSLSAAASAADLVLQPLLDPGRCSRVVEWSSRDASLPSLDEVLSRTTQSIIVHPEGTPMEREISWSVQHAYVSRLMALGDSSDATPAVRARARKAVAAVLSSEAILASSDSTGNAALIASELKAYLSRPMQPSAAAPTAPAALPGAPIGAFGDDAP